MASTQIGKIAVTAGGVWNATTAYPVITVVTSADRKSSYISKKDVPAGTELSNTEYWQKIVDASDLIVDATLTQAGVAADAKAVSDALALKVDAAALAKTKRRIGVLYKLTQGQAWDAEDDTTKAFGKAVPSGAHASAVQKIGGKTVVLNQNVRNGNFVGTTSWTAAGSSTISASNNELTVTLTSAAIASDYSGYALSEEFSIISGHKYLICVDIYPPRSGSAIIDTLSHLGSDRTFEVVSNRWNRIGRISTASNAYDTLRLSIYPRELTDGYQQGDTYKIRNVMCVDLTKMFGTTAAATITTPEQAYALGVPRIYIPYDTGELVSADVNAINAIGFNLLNPDEFEPNTRIYVSSGSALSYSGLTASGWIEAFPSTDYYFKMHSIGSSYAGTAFYDADKRYISGVAHTSAASYMVGILTTPPNCAYIRTCWANSDTDLCVNVSDADFNGQFTEFTPVQSFPIPAAVRTQYPLRSAEAAYDSYEYDEVTGKWSHVQRVETRAHQSGDDSDATVLTDGTTTHCTLAAPVITDITDLMPVDNLIECEAGGIMMFSQSDTALAVPNKLTYFINLSEAVE